MTTYSIFHVYVVHTMQAIARVRCVATRLAKPEFYPISRRSAPGGLTYTIVTEPLSCRVRQTLDYS